MGRFQTLLLALAASLLGGCYEDSAKPTKENPLETPSSQQGAFDLSAAPVKGFADDLWLTSDTDLCTQTHQGLRPENIRAGISLAGVEGTAIIDYPACSVSLKTNCVTSASFPAVVTAGLAAKVAAGESLAGVTGTAAAETRSPCSGDGQTGCLTNASYPAAPISGLAAKVVSGHTVAGVAGSAIEQKSDCAADGAIDCATTATYPATQTAGLAAKVIIGHTVAGVSGSAVEESNPDCSGADQSSCVATSTYKTIDLSNKDSGGALDLTGGNFEASVKSASLFEYWDENGARHTNSGDADITPANIDTGVTIFGENGSANPPPDCSAITFGTWILVPGDSDYGTNDFCVMKYEAKNDGGNKPTSTAADTPWVNIDQQDSKTECASLGNYPLPINAQVI